MTRRRFQLWMLFLAFVGVAGTSTALPEPPLDNAQIVKLTRLDMGDTVIVAKIKSASEASFDTSTDALVKLKEAGVSKAVITAMIEWPGTAPAAPGRAGSGSEPTVRLRSREGTIALKAVYGTSKTQATPFSVNNWVQFNDLSAKTRISDRRPTVLIATDKDPRGHWWFVRTSQQEDEAYRYFDLEGGGVFSVVWSGSPDGGAIVKCDAVEEQPGLWGLTPLKDLKSGEYGLFTGQAEGALLFDFGVDR